MDTFVDSFHSQLRERAILAQSDVLRACQQFMTDSDVLELWRYSFPVILVDDAEDNIPLANDFLEVVTDNFTVGRTVVAGDPYGSARQTVGAAPYWFSNLHQRLPVVELDRNYIVPAQVGLAARSLIPAQVPPQRWCDDNGRVVTLPTASSFEAMLDQVVERRGG